MFNFRLGVEHTKVGVFTENELVDRKTFKNFSWIRV